MSFRPRKILINIKFHNFDEPSLCTVLCEILLSTLRRRSGELWKQLKDLDETPALGFQWVSSVIRKSLLSSLRLNYQSAVRYSVLFSVLLCFRNMSMVLQFSMGNKDPVQLDSNGPNIGSLHQPVSILLKVSASIV